MCPPSTSITRIYPQLTVCFSRIADMHIKMLLL